MSDILLTENTTGKFPAQWNILSRLFDIEA